MRPTFFEHSFHFTDAEETAQHLADAYGSARIDREFKYFGQDLAGDEHIQLHTGRFEGAYSAHVQLEQFVVATSTGPCGWEEGSSSGDLQREPALFRPHTPYINHLSDTTNQAVVFDAPALLRSARRLFGREDLAVEFDGPRPVDSGSAGTWLAVLALAREMRGAGLLQEQLLRANLFRLLSTTVLTTFRLVGDRDAMHASAERQRVIHARAEDFFHAFSSLPITVDDAAAEVGASVLELEAAFRSLDPEQSSPSAYLRAIRLQAAYHDLADGDPTLGDTVAEIARRWGFGSPSRFAARFRSAYGVNPKWVLDR